MRLALLLVVSVGLAAQTPRAELPVPVKDVLQSIVEGLATGEPGSVLAAFDKSCACYTQVRQSVLLFADSLFIDALLDIPQAQVQADRVEARVIWTMRIRRNRNAPDWVERRVESNLVFARSKGRWRVVKMDPDSVFSAPQ